VEGGYSDGREGDLLKDPTDANAFDDPLAVSDFLQRPLPAVLVHNVRDADFSTNKPRPRRGSRLLRVHAHAGAGIPRPILHALGAHLGEELNEDAARVGAFGGVDVDKDDGALKHATGRWCCCWSVVDLGRLVGCRGEGAGTGEGRSDGREVFVVFVNLDSVQGRVSEIVQSETLLARCRHG
jgi:hypothetical protein